MGIRRVRKPRHALSMMVAFGHNCSYGGVAEEIGQGAEMMSWISGTWRDQMRRG
jgi:hypothetical protein